MPSKSLQQMSSEQRRQAIVHGGEGKRRAEEETQEWDLQRNPEQEGQRSQDQDRGRWEEMYTGKWRCLVFRDPPDAMS